jgi:purine-nucleoside phosphorylase
MNESHVNESVAYIREHCSHAPRIAIVLGSGLGDFADNLPHRTALSTADIPHYPVSTVEGHKGKLVFATLNGKPLLAFQGRIHFYESRDLETVLYPIHIAHALGTKTLIVTNAAGGVNRNFQPGDLMILSDHINFTLQRAPRRFTSAAPGKPIYSPALIAKAEQAARANAINVRKGVYIGLKGPSYETASEVEMLARIGADAVGMSTVIETSCAAALGMDVLGISCITNLGTGISATILSHAEVTEVGNRVKATFAALVAATIELLE